MNSQYDLKAGDRKKASEKGSLSLASVKGKSLSGRGMDSAL